MIWPPNPMENYLGWDNNTDDQMPPTIWSTNYQQYYVNFSDSSSLELHGGYSNIMINNINLHQEASFDPAAHLMRFADDTDSQQLLSSLPPTTTTIIPELETFSNFNSQTVDAVDGISVILPNLSNFSSSSRETTSEAISRGSPCNADDSRRHGIKRKLTSGGGFEIFFDSEAPEGNKKSRIATTENIDFRQRLGTTYEADTEAMAQVKEMIYRAAAMRPVNLINNNLYEVGATEMKRKSRKNVRISSDPQTAAARHRRERISERLRVLQKLVPGGSKMDTASMLDEAANYLKFLKTQVTALETLGLGGGTSFNNNFTMHA